MYEFVDGDRPDTEKGAPFECYFCNFYVKFPNLECKIVQIFKLFNDMDEE